MVRDETQVYGRGIVGLTLEAWLDACRGLSLPFSRYEAPKFRGSRPGWGDVKEATENTSFHPEMVVKSKGIPLISGKPRLVKYYNLTRLDMRYEDLTNDL